MTGIDTNILIRYIIRDDPQQTRSASIFIESLSREKPGFVPLVATAELGWVLNRSYKLRRGEFIQALKSVLNSEALFFENETLLKQALLIFAQTNAEFGDCLIASSARSRGCVSTVTFDRRAANTLGMQLLP